MTTTLVELCAGSAAVSLRWLSSKAKPPMGYQGGKLAYADRILAAMGLQPGGGASAGNVVLVEPGPWGEAWELWRSASGRAQTIELLQKWHEIDQRKFWDRVSASPMPLDPVEWVATWAALQYFSYGSKPVRPSVTIWKHHGFNTANAYRADISKTRRKFGGRYETGLNSSATWCQSGNRGSCSAAARYKVHQNHKLG